MYGQRVGLRKMAVKRYRKAAEQGDAEAQSNLGAMYANGEGVPENYILSYQWLSLSAAQGDAGVEANKTINASWMTPSQIADAQKASSKCFANNYVGSD